MQYFKRYWDEPRGDKYDFWGCSWWYYEADDAGVVTRQIEAYDHGPTLLRHEGCLEDEFGGLTDQPIDFELDGLTEISRPEFESVWESKCP